MTTNAIRKREGFEGQRAIVLPKKITEVCAKTAPLNSLYVTDIGFYPHATHHYRERPSGVAQNILIYCLEGSGWLEVPSGNYKVNPNEYLIIPANMRHKYGADEENPWSIYWAHFKGIHSPDYSAILSRQNRNFVIYTPFLEERIRVFDSIYKVLESGYSIDNLTFSSIGFTYFLGLMSYAEKFASAHPSIVKDPVDLSIEYMQNHLGVPLMLESIASSVNLSVSQYSSVFRKKTGYSPIEYFNHLKVQRACQFLQFTALRISEIALKLGIEDAYYFSRMFTKIMGISPLDYRKKKH